jgi:tetratricopeptide (TPR) repeat protein
MALNRFALVLLLSLLPGIGFAAPTPLQDASQLFRQGRSAQALDKVNGYLAGNAKDPQGRFLKGLILAEMDRSQDAIKTFNELIADYPELPEPYNNLAVLYASQEKYELAKSNLEKAIQANPTYATAYENLGDVYAKMASQAYGKAVQLEKSHSSAQTKRTLIKSIFPLGESEKAKPGKHSSEKAAATEHDAAVMPNLTTTAPIVKTGDADKTATVSKPANKAASADANVEKTIQAWAAAWSARNVGRYLSFYSDSFVTPQGMSRTDWEAQRKQRLTSVEEIKVAVSDLKIEHNDSKATASFKERYESNILKGDFDKTLTLELHNGSWKIVSEK